MTDRMLAYEGHVELPLTNGGTTLVDAADVPLIGGRGLYLGRNGYVELRPEKRRGAPLVRLHRHILGHPSGLIDHINRNKLDNTRANLRVTTKAINSINSKRHSSNTSGVRGVYHYKPTGRWQARIGVDGRSLHLGYYPTFGEAVAARRAAEIRYFGEECPE